MSSLRALSAGTKKLMGRNGASFSKTLLYDRGVSTTQCSPMYLIFQAKVYRSFNHCGICYSRNLTTTTTASSAVFPMQKAMFSQVLACGEWARKLSMFTRRGFHSDSSRCSKTSASADILTESELAGLAVKIMAAASRVDVMVRSVPQTKVERIIADLYNCGIPLGDIQTLLVSHPRYITSSKVITVIDSLLTSGFQPGQLVSVLQEFEPILDISAAKIMEVCDSLRQARFYDRSLPIVISKDPSILLLTKKEISGRVSELRQLFTSADVINLILKCPQLLSEDWSDIQAKFDYVYNKMKVTQKQMVYATLFRHSLQHIKQRHAFLVRAGLFDMSKRREGEKSPNARLDQIIDSADEAFCRKFGFKLEDYTAFCRLYDKEISVQESDDES